MQRDRSKSNDGSTAPIRIYGRLSNAVIRDRSLSLAAKIIAANRVTFVGQFKTRVRTQSASVCRGLGKNNSKAAIAELRRWGFFGPEQMSWANNRGAGNAARFKDTAETIAVPDSDYTVVFRCWFNGHLNLLEAGALLFVASGLAGPMTYSDDVASFLKVSEKTARKGLLRLEEIGYIAAADRDAQGRFLRRAYRMIERTRNVRISAGVHKAGVREAGDLRRTPEDGGFPLTQATNDIGRALEVDPSIVAGRSDLTMWEEPKLLGWLDDASGVLEDTITDFKQVDEEAVAAVAEVMSWAELRSCIQAAADGRLSPVILSQQGLWAVVWIAAFVMEYLESEPTPAEALAITLNTIARRIARRPGAYLGSLRLVAERIFWQRPHDTLEHEYFFGDRQEPMFDISEDDETVILIDETDEG